jgi:Galactose oxidase, central domain
MEWIYPQTMGKAPSPRYKHSGNFMQSSKALVIYGGFNDQIYLNDVFFFNMDNLSWVECRLHNSPIFGRASHCSLSHGSKLFILGGINNQGYLNADMMVVEFDQMKSKQLVEKEKLVLKETDSISERSLMEPRKRNVSRLTRMMESFRPETENNEYGLLSQKPLQKEEIPSILEGPEFISLSPLPEKELTEEIVIRRDKAKKHTMKLL